MDEVNETLKKQIAALSRVISAANYYKRDNVPCQIEGGLFLGSVGAAANKDALKNFNVTRVLTVANILTPAHPNDFVYKTINVVDREDVDIKQYFNECFDFIDEGKRLGGGTLVHCFAGRSRSATIVVAYLMKTHGMSLSQALEHVKSRQPVASPNLGFIRQLEDFEKSLQGRGKRKIGETSARSKRSRKSTSQAIIDCMSRIAAASEGRAAALDREQCKKTPPVSEVLPELCKIDAIARDPDFRRRCVNMMMHSMCRDMYAGLKWSEEVLLNWLREHAYNAPHLQIPPKR